ncbi:MAG: HAMP domain-containing histidine kinase, partial [Phycisphaerae bacterium]|nr:HAMP domain-containing histidine kinase [Phycisphaerae bacterium]
LQTVIRDACAHYDLLVERRRLTEALQQKNRDLEQANAQLLEANRLKSSFIQVASHELRTPLAILLGLSKLALRQPEMPRGLRELLERMDRAADRLNRLVDRIITLLAAERFELSLDRQEAEVAPLLRQAADDVRPFTELRSQPLHVDVPDDLGRMSLDPAKIRDSLNHLLLNAVKFTPDGNPITLRARRGENGQLVVQVIDTGCGIDPESLPRLFTPFFTSFDVSRHSSGEYEYGKRGLGLGLSVVKSFTELHGGTVSVESQPGKGATFTMTIPTLPGPPSG